MSDIYDVLKEDHDNHRETAAALAETEGDSKERRELFLMLRAEVDAHAAAEEQTFYAELMSHEDGHEKARHSVAEHKEAADILEELDEMDFSSPGWLTRYKTLKEKLEHHMDEEENEIFARARKVIDQAKAADLADSFRKEKARELADQKDKVA